MIIKHIPTGRSHFVTDDSVIEEVMLLNGWRRQNCILIDANGSGKKEKIYCGWRDKSGNDKATVNGKPLEHIKHHSPSGMNWGYGGSGPADLALSILTDFLEGDKPQAMQWHQDFKWDFVAFFRDSWSLTSTEIDAWLKGKKKNENS